jgi:hypothetical protein
LSVDTNGQLAVFTGSYGPVPANLVVRELEVDSAMRSLMDLPVSGPARDVVAVPGNMSAWLAWSARGFYAYTWHDRTGPYVRVCTPSMPLMLGDLSLRMQSLACMVAFPAPFLAMPHVVMPYTSTEPVVDLREHRLLDTW